MDEVKSRAGLRGEFMSTTAADQPGSPKSWSGPLRA